MKVSSPSPSNRTLPGVIRCAVCAQESHVGNDIRYVHAMLIDYVSVASFSILLPVLVVVD